MKKHFFTGMAITLAFFAGMEFYAWYYNVQDLLNAFLECREERDKHYEAACLFKDILNSGMCGDDAFSSEVENLYDEWTMDFDALNFEHLKEEDLENYHWAF